MSPRSEPGTAGVRFREATDDMLPSRRRFLKTSALMGASFLVWGCGSSPDPQLDASIPDGAPPDGTPPVDPNAPLPEGMLAPEQTGMLTAVELASLWQIFEHIGKRWNSGSFCTIDSESKLAEILSLKTLQSPSYLAEYQLAHELLTGLTQQHGPEQALDQMFEFPVDAPTTTVAGHVRMYTLSELIRLQVTQGGFRVLGYLNYPGFEGGPMDDPDNLPYRIMEA